MWRTVASAAATVAFLIAASLAAFGLASWEAFSEALLGQAGEVLVTGGRASADWGYIQTVYGLMRYLNAGAGMAWLVQGVSTLGAAMIVYLVWRSQARYALKAATLSAAALLATPYAFAYDLAAIAVPVAFLASDQISSGVLRGEPTAMIALFGVSVALLIALGSEPFGPILVIILLCVILRRIRFYRRRLAPLVTCL